MNDTTRHRFRGLRLAATALVLVALPAIAGQGGPAPRRGPVAALRGALAAADVSDVQREKARSVLEAAKAPARDFVRQAREGRRTLRELASSENPDPKAVGEAFLLERSTLLKLKTVREKVTADVRAVLTPEQAARFDAFLAGARYGAGAGPGLRRQGPGPGPMPPPRDPIAPPA